MPIISRVPIDKVLISLICFISIFGQSIFYLSGAAVFVKISLLILSVMLGIISLVLNFNKENIKKSIFLIFLFIYIIIILWINLLKGSNGLVNYFYEYVFLLFLILYFSTNTLEKSGTSYLLQKIANLILAMATISLILWFCISILHLISPSKYVQLNWGTPHYIPSYFNLYFETQKITFGSLEFMRNTFIYPEAPIFSFYLSYALVVKVFLESKKIVSWEVLVLIATILSTGSSTGFIVIAAVILTRLIINLKSRTYRIIISVIVLCVFSIVVIFIFQQKMMNNSDSLNIRISDILIGFHSALQHPLIGNGINNYSAVLNEMDIGRLMINGNTGFSSGLALIAAYTGLSLSIIYLIPILIGMCLGLKNNIGVFFFATMILFLLVTTIVQENYILLISLAYLLTLIYKKET